MKDRIISAFLKDFQDEYKLGHLNDAECFERFSNYCVISRHHPDAFELEDVSVGGSGDLGLDGVAILVDEHLVSAPEDIDYFKRALRRLDVDFVFVQSKTSTSFDGAEIGNFLGGVRGFFEETLDPSANATLQSLHALKEYVYDHAIDMDRRPALSAYYVTTGTWKENVHLQSVIDRAKKDLEKTDLFGRVDIIPVDAEGIKRLYRNLKHKITREIVFDKHTILPTISAVQEAYIGLLPVAEYLKLISDDDGTLNKRIFYDNVRDFQGHNAVNREIETTLKDRSTSDRFALLNNGVTVVARDARKIGARFVLHDYQIVNGCQTSHVLYLNRDSLANEISVPIKLIVTTDADVTNQIIKGTNRQTEVKLEALRALAPFHKKLEEFYQAASRDRASRIYYERRSKQYEHLAIPRTQIITITSQTKCFLAMFLNEPHSTHRYYGELLDAYESRMFLDSHAPLPYYLSGLALSVLDRLLERGIVDRDLKSFRYQMLMVFRLQKETQPLPHLNSKGIDSYCQYLMDILDDQPKAAKAFIEASSLITKELSSVDRFEREPPERRKAFTARLIDAAAGKKTAVVAGVSRQIGEVMWFSVIKGYGFVRCADGTDAYIHHGSVGGRGYRFPKMGEIIEFTRVETGRGPQAHDVEFTDEE